MSIGWALTILGTVLRECWVLPTLYDYYDFVIVFSIFFNIGQWILLFIVVWGVNRLLSQRLDSSQGIVKVATLAIVGVMAALTAGYTGLNCYNTWQAMARGTSGYRYVVNYKTYYDAEKFAVAYDVLYILSVVAGGAISMALLMKLRSKGIAINDVIKRIVALTLCMVLSNIFILVVDARSLEKKYLDMDVNCAMYYLNGFFQIFSYFAIISLCKSNFWKESATQTAYNTTGYDQPAYAPVQPPPQQQFYHAGPMVVPVAARS
ncbi:uncharacterized protein N0V89_011123 [Didymosphaeria variabile]|uniref:Uncharacterized protein n=1 Tax=Didymosphaeria variabile TaxID=1932322 RepID=A0A9W8XCH8_9PLEO|nr:uncharacterized protein N0V89_011123 [Didymosphaeria variabile]KAJ4347184.1 hypothetical protein N0V89_011123 [Didymosphaeria variabile]